MMDTLIRPGSRLALAQSAIMERVFDDPKTVDWFGVACALTNARAADLKAEKPS